jgi:hypothetical protein
MKKYFPESAEMLLYYSEGDDVIVAALCNIEYGGDCCGKHKTDIGFKELQRSASRN